jgi:hypothetical protein
MSGLPLDDGPDISAAAHDAARGHVVYLTEHGERLAAIVPAELAALLEDMTPDQARERVEDLGLTVLKVQSEGYTGVLATRY